MKWPTKQEEHAYMKMRQNQNKVACLSNKAENWMLEKLNQTQYKWKRQSQWGYRLFDFWNYRLGIAVEVDGNNHKQQYDKSRDKFNYEKSGILVLRVRNFNEEDAKTCIDYINNCKILWNDRRTELGLKPITNN